MKKNLKTFYLMAGAALLSACSATSPLPTFRTSDGVRCLIGRDTVELRAYADNIIKVSRRSAGRIDSVQSMPFVDEPAAPVAFKVRQSKDGVALKTRELTARVDPSGRIVFTDSRGRVLTEALPPLRPLEQQFEAADEAVMGLGQFQDGLADLKGVPLRLQQYNQVIANPFLVSTRGYGILWHNTSVTDVNYPVNRLDGWQTVNEEKQVKKTFFTPAKTGRYKFAVECVNAENRFGGPVLLTVGGDTVIHYNTPWVPDFHSGTADLQQGRRYEVVFTNTGATTATTVNVLYNEPDLRITTFSSRYGNTTDYFVVAGTPAEAIAGYRKLTGKATMFAKWALGFWQCRERYSSQKELLENAAAYRLRGIPVDNIVQDWNYWPGGTWGPEWDRSRYPDPAAMCRELKAENLHLMVSVWPWLTNKKIEDAYGLKAFKIDQTNNMDFFSPDLRGRYYRLLRDSMFAQGVDAIWLDGTEPEHFPKGTTRLGNVAHNALAYSYGVTRSVYEGRRKDEPALRVFNLTRSAFAGQQRFGAAVWSGDVLASWEQFAEQIPAGLNLSMSGMPFWTTDIGGFFRDSHSLNPHYKDQYTDEGFKELLTRWFQFGTLCPLFRIHGYVSRTEVWRYGAAFEAMARKFIDLRYRLLPYIYSEAARVTTHDAILMKPLIHDYPADTRAADCADQYLFGRSLLVCPVVKAGARRRAVYLPEGSWTDFWDGSVHRGPAMVDKDAPVDRLPLLVKTGSVVPVGPSVQYAMEPVSAPLRLLIYPGADGSYTLYEDEGDTYNYEQGAYSTIAFTWDDAKRTLTIGPRSGSFAGMAPERTFEVALGGHALDAARTLKVHYTGSTVRVKCDELFDTRR